MSKIVTRWLFLLVVGAAVLAPPTGCAFRRERVNIRNPYEKLERVKVGQTRIEELVAILGTEPSNIIAVPPDRQAYVFGFGDSKTARLGLILLSFQKSNIGFDTAVFVVNAEGTVQRMLYTSNSEDLKWQFWPFGKDSESEKDGAEGEEEKADGVEEGA